MPQSDVFCMDCMDGLRTTPDKYYDLAIVDPPYGGGSSQNIQVERERERERDGRRIARRFRTVQGCNRRTLRRSV